MQGKLKHGRFRIGHNKPFYISSGIVKITDTENHPIYGKRYKISGYDEWFEENCFEWIKINIK